MPRTTEYHWVFGRNSHIEFPNGGEPVSRANTLLKTDEGCASISDSSGKLLFFTDGSKLWDGTNTVVVAPSLGGHKSSANSAIIIPPAGTGKRYHIFAMNEAGSSLGGTLGPLNHTEVSVIGSVVTPGTTTALGSGPTKATEHLAAIPHSNCMHYWVIATDHATDELCVILIDGDGIPPAANFKKFPYGKTAGAGWCMKISPTGAFLAVTNTNDNGIPSLQIFRFDRSSGNISFDSEITNIETNSSGAYGVEFSPNEKYIYYTTIRSKNIYRHEISLGTKPHSASDNFGPFTSNNTNPAGYAAGALQLGPNDKIYGVKTDENTLFVLSTPDLVNPGFQSTALDASGSNLILNDKQWLGLPTFTRISNDCIDDECSTIDAQVDEILQNKLDDQINSMRPCNQPRGAPPSLPRVAVCTPLKMDPVKPNYYSTWGNSRCDCIESDDTEVMNLTICTPDSNVTLSNLTVHKLEVVDGADKPVATLPDGSPSVTLVPIGPHCFDDIAPCSCVTREFSVRLRGAVSGPYKILVSGICYDVCFHNDDKACFQFEVCKD